MPEGLGARQIPSAKKDSDDLLGHRCWLSQMKHFLLLPHRNIGVYGSEIFTQSNST